MTFPFSQSTLFGQMAVTNQYPAQQAVIGNRDAPVSVLLVNTDPTNTIYLANNSAYLTVDVTRVTPLPPQSSVVFDGTQDVFAFAGAGKPAVLARFPSGIAYTQGVGIVPLAVLGSVSAASAAVITAGTGFVALNQVDVSGFVSYDLNAYMFSQSPGTVGAVVSGQVQLQWFDDLVSGIPVFEEDWFIWSGRASTSLGNVNTLSGSGPMHGRYMTVTVFIPPLAAATGTLQYINIFGSNRSVPYSDWRQNGQAVNPQINTLLIENGGGTSFDNILASLNAVAIATATTGFVPCGLYSGPVWYRYQVTTAPANNTVLVAIAGGTGGQFTFGTNNPNVLLNIPNDTLEHEGQLILPRSPVMLIVRGPAAGSLNLAFTLAAQQAA